MYTGRNGPKYQVLTSLSGIPIFSQLELSQFNPTQNITYMFCFEIGIFLNFRMLSGPYEVMKIFNFI